jgi:hypothetical protein
MDNALRKLLPGGRCGKVDADVVQQNAGTANHDASRIKSLLESMLLD